MSDRTRGLVLHSHAHFYDAVVRLLTFGRGRRLHERLADRARLVAGERVLDVGCGTGSLALAAAALVGSGGAVHAIDASAEMIARATRKARRHAMPVDFRVATAEALPFDDGRFDAVFATLMLHHLPRTLRRDLMSEAARVLRPGGRVLLADFEASGGRGGGWFARWHRHGAVSRDDVGRLLQGAGFRVLDSGPLGVRDIHWTLAARDADP